MPNRIIRESSLTSPTLAQLSDGGERLFWRLTVVADDHGRFEADADVVRSACFPKLMTRFSVARVARLLRELVDTSLIQLYHVKDRTYGSFLTWSTHQRVRAETSKFPDPACGQPLTSADTCGQPHANAAVVGSRSRESRTRVGSLPSTDFSTGFPQFWLAYPRKAGKGAAERAWAKIRPSDELVAVMLAALERAKRLPQWTKDNGEFIPHPATWLNQRRWEDEVPTRSQARSIADDLTPAQREAHRKRMQQVTAGIGKVV